MTRTTLPLSALALALVAAACSGGSSASPTTGADGAAPGDRCQTNRDYGTITFLTGFSYAASSGIVEIIAAEEQGYFDELCLDVEIQPSFAEANAALLASGQAQLASVGSISDVVGANVNAEAGVVAIAQYGNTAIEAIAVPADSGIETIADLKGKLMGVKGDIPASLQNLLAAEGAPRGSFDENILDSFDPVAGGFDLGIDALPVYINNEPYAMDAAGFEYRLFRPVDFDIASSFGLIITSDEFLADHPSIVEDFLAAAFRGYEFARANPDVAVGYSVKRLGGTDLAYLTEITEGPRWASEIGIIDETQPDGLDLGIPNEDLLRAEVELMVANGIYADMPDLATMVDAGPARAAYGQNP